MFSICEWGQNQPWQWGAGVGHLWRSTGDISDNWSSMLSIVKQSSTHADAAGPGHWNDPDMLEVGNGGMTDTEYRSHFSLWSMMAAPLLIGSDLRRATQPTYDILLNHEVIAVDQDPLGVQARVLSNADGRWVLAKPLAGGDLAVALFNENSHGARISTTAAAAGLPPRPGYAARDLWQHTETETAGTIGAYVPAHGTVMYRVSADPRWPALPPMTSLETAAASPGQGSAGQYVPPGRPVAVTGSLTNHGGLPALRGSVALTGPTDYQGPSYEAEAGGSTLAGGARISSCAGCSGGQKVGFIGNGPANWVRLDGVTATAAGGYKLTIYAAVSGTRSLFVSVNGGTAVEVPVTGTSFATPVPVSLEVTLAAGSNSIRFGNDTAFGPDLDRIVVTGAAPPGPWPVSPGGPVTAAVLLTDHPLTGSWQVTPPADAPPGSYQLAITASYRTTQGGPVTITAPLTLVIPAAAPAAAGALSGSRWLEAVNGWGPVEIDMSNGEKAGRDGRPLSVGGVPYARGLGVHAPAELLFYLAARCTRLTVDVGLDDEKRGNQAGSVAFQIWADGTEAADSGVLTWQDPARTLSADLTGAAFLRLVVTDGGDDTNSDHADWAGPQLTC